MRKAYIIGGGTSLLGFDWTKLPRQGTIAVNAAIFDVPSPQYFVTMDYSFFRKICHKIRHFNSIPCSKFFVAGLHHPYLVEFQGTFRDTRMPRLVYDLQSCDIILKSRKAEGCGFSWNDFRSGGNSGFSALQLAVLLGYTEIYLLGIDMVCNRGTHYHHTYPQNQSIFEKRLSLYVERFQQGISAIKRRGGIRVVSCSAISTLNDIIEYVPFEKTI